MPLGVNYYDLVLDALFGATKMAAAPTTLYAALFSADPGADDTGTEIVGGGYSRVAIANDASSFDPASSGSKVLKVAIAWPQASTSWGQVRWVGFYDQSSGGTLVCSMPFAGGVLGTLPTTLTPRIAANTLTVTYWDLSA